MTSGFSVYMGGVNGKEDGNYYNGLNRGYRVCIGEP